MMISGVLCSLATLFVTQMKAQDPASPQAYGPTTQVRTTATAIRTVAPDLAIVRFEFTGRDTTPGGAARAAATLGDGIRKAVAKVGVPDDSILGRGSVPYPGDQSMQVEVKPNAEFRRYDTTYVFRDLIEVRIRNLKQVSRVISAALDAGAQKLALLQFSSSRVEQVGQEALEEATRQARHNAELMAKASGGRLGRPLELTTQREPSSCNALFNVRGAQTRDNTYDPMAAPPGAELRASVTGSWELLAAADSLRGQ